MRSKGYCSWGLFVRPLLNISPLERLFVSQWVPHTQRAAKVRMFVWFSLKMLRCRARALPSLYGYALVGHFYSATCTCVHITIGAHAQYYTWCNRRIFYKTSRVCEMLLFVLFIMPPSKVLYAHNVKLWYHQGNLCKGKSKT